MFPPVRISRPCRDVKARLAQAIDEGAMHAMTKGMEPPREEASDAEQKPPAPTGADFPTVIWVHDGPVCVDIVDITPAPPPNPHCTCTACAAARHADWAERFL